MSFASAPAQTKTAAAAGTVATARDTDCLACHGDQGPALEASVHGRAGVGCVDCHADLKAVKDFPHADKLVSVNCAACHGRETRMYTAGIHGGTAAARSGPPVTCKDCHGTHGVLGASDPASPTSPANLPLTCGRCHLGATAHFAEGRVHSLPERAVGVAGRAPLVVRSVYGVVIAAIVGAFLLFIAADLFVRAVRRRAARGRVCGPDVPGDEELSIRLSLAERVQHGLLILTLFTLMATGLPLFLSGFKPLAWLLPGGQGSGFRGVLHRVAAVVLVLNLVWSAATTIFTARGRASFQAMVPRARDFRDAFEQLFHNLGVTRLLCRLGFGRKLFARHPSWLFEAAPLYDRYNFVEKFEYWAVGWGSAVMITSGFFMWQVDLSLRLFPLWVHNIFIVVHSYEALLAFLAVIIWHMYNVHFNPEDFPMSMTWLDGKITGRELRTLHPLEYERMMNERKKAAAEERRKDEERRRSPGTGAL
ncbi:MAG TPA: cytochrome c3 family protein [Terriglobales bacterium]|nr:cytochrome c3 family protein [Terriglobales bacterium]